MSGARRNIVGLADATERGLRFDPLPEVACDETAGMRAFRFDHAGIDGIDADLARPQFLSEHSSDGVNSGFGGYVGGSVRREGGADAGANVDDAAAFGANELDRFFGGEQEAEHIEIELLVEQFFGYVFQGRELVGSGVVN